MTQKVLAEMLACDPRTVRRLEHGMHRPTREQVAQIARALAPEGQHPQVLDHILCDLIGKNFRVRTRKMRRRELLSNIYLLPAERTAQRLALEKQLRNPRLALRTGFNLPHS